MSTGEIVELYRAARDLNPSLSREETVRRVVAVLTAEEKEALLEDARNGEPFILEIA